MKQVKGVDALDVLRDRYGIEPDDEDVVEAHEQMMVAQMIYDARIEAGLTQQELANLIDTQQSVISRLEDADYEGHSLPMLRKIARALKKQVQIRFVPIANQAKTSELHPVR